MKRIHVRTNGDNLFHYILFWRLSPLIQKILLAANTQFPIKRLPPVFLKSKNNTHSTILYKNIFFEIVLIKGWKFLHVCSWPQNQILSSSILTKKISITELMYSQRELIQTHLSTNCILRLTSDLDVFKKSISKIFCKVKHGLFWKVVC